MDRKIEASAAMLTLYRTVTVKRAKRSVSSHNEFISVTSTADDVCSVSAGFKPRHQTPSRQNRSEVRQGAYSKSSHSWAGYKSRRPHLVPPWSPRPQPEQTYQTRTSRTGSMEPGLIKLCPAQPDHGWIDPNTPIATFWTLQHQQAECKHLSPEFTTRLLSTENV